MISLMKEVRRVDVSIVIKVVEAKAVAAKVKAIVAVIFVFLLPMRVGLISMGRSFIILMTNKI